MNKKDIAEIRRQFKFDNLNLTIKEIHNAYTNSKSGEIIHFESECFDRMEEEKQELYFANFKKLLSGQLGSKLYELDFLDTSVEGAGQKLLYGALKDNSNKDEIIKSIAKGVKYTTDYIITLIYANYLKPANKKNKNEVEGDDDTSYSFDFMLCSINAIAPSKKGLKFDFEEKEIIANSQLDLTINLNSPLDGFMYPAFNDNSADANKVIYSTKKANEPNMEFVEKVLNSEIKMTAEVEKYKFSELIKVVIGDKVAPETLHSVYEQINNRIEGVEGSEIPTLDKIDIRRILENSGIEKLDNLDKYYEDILGDTNYALKTTSIVPNYTSKSIKLSNSVANVAISPKELNSIKQIVRNGKKCLLIELDEDVNVEGFILESNK